MDKKLAPKNKDGPYILLPVSDLATANYEWTEETKILLLQSDTE